jgi:hypothetical protein
MPSPPEVTRILPALPFADPQAQLLEDTWLLTIFAVLLAIAFPWFVSAVNIDFAATSWALLALGAVGVALSLANSLDRRSARARHRLLALLNAAGLIALALIWQRAGGLQNPLLLLAFLLPVIGASALSRWQPYLSAALALLLVAGVAVSQDPELGWFAAGRWLERLFGSGTHAAGSTGVFLGFYAPVGYDIVLLEVFGILVFAAAVAAESLGNSFQRLLEHLSSARAEAASAQSMWTGLMLRLPLPAFLIDVETLEIVQTSDRLAPFAGADAGLAGRGLFDVLEFSYPEAIEALIAGAGGSVAAATLHSPNGLRMADVKVEHTVHDRRRLALVLLIDVTEAFCVAAALDVDEHAVFVMDAGGRVMMSNRPARTLFPDGPPRAATAASADTWWAPGLTGRRRVRVTLSRRSYQALCTSVAITGEPEELHVVALSPAPPANLGASADTGEHSAMSRLR